MEEPRTRYQIGCIAADIALTLVFLAVYVFFTLRPGALIDGELFSPRRQRSLLARRFFRRSLSRSTGARPFLWFFCGPGRGPAMK